jgi:hypothetical protein
MMDEELFQIRKTRREISAECDHEVDRVLDYYIRVQGELKHSGKYRFASKADRSGGEAAEVIAAARENCPVD